MTTLPSGAESPTGWAGPAELNFLLQEVRTARANIEALRAQTRSLAANPEQRRLLESLENYVAALQARHLPVPPAIRDVIINVDLEHRRITVEPTPGLLPEEQGPQAGG